MSWATELGIALAPVIATAGIGTLVWIGRALVRFELRLGAIEQKLGLKP